MAKKELALLYLPVLFFADLVITPAAPALAYYATISLLLASLILRNSTFFRYNIFALLIIIYFLLLLPQSSNLEFIRPYIFGVVWLFISLPLIHAIYQKYSREIIFQELARSALLILMIFSANVLVSSLYKYSPYSMYGITSGVLYGNMYAVDFNILPIAVFITTLSLIKRKNIFQFLILVLAITFIMLTLRRSVMGLSMAGIICGFVISITQKNMKKVLVYGGITLLIGYIILTNTEFMSVFNERYELRNLENRELEEEKRFIEYELVYRDMFIYQDYSPWFGFELFNSWGNYGRGVLVERSLHSDLTSIAHSSGLIGLALYILMVFTAFRQSYRHAATTRDKLIFLFSGMTFLVFTTTGRYTETGNMMFLFLVLLLPLTQEDPAHQDVAALAPNNRVAA
jgi:O-antigen ligase